MTKMKILRRRGDPEPHRPTPAESRSERNERYRKKNQHRVVNAMLTEEAVAALEEICTATGESKAKIISKALLDLQERMGCDTIDPAPNMSENG